MMEVVEPSQLSTTVNSSVLWMKHEIPAFEESMKEYVCRIKKLVEQPMNTVLRMDEKREKKSI